MTNLTGTMPLSSLLLAGLLTVGLVACGETDKETGDDDGGAADGGADGGGGDGGGGDGGGGGGGDGGGGGGTDTGIMLGGYYGEATVTGAGWSGFEEAYYVGLNGAVNCSIVSNTDGNSLSVASCAACDWAFSVDTSGSALGGTTGCDLIGVDASMASGYDGYTYNYGYQSDYYISGYGEYGVLQYYFSGYGWYAVASADYTGDQFMYDWPSGYYYYYL